jgi:hypothetical protein
MALNNRLVSELIRQRMGWTDDSQAARVINLIPEALKAFGRSYAADPFTRPLVTTPKATTTIPIGARGAVNLVTGYDTYQFLLEYLDKGLMYFLPSVTVSPYVLSGGTYASGYWTFNANPQHNETIAVNGVTCTFKYVSLIVSGAGVTALNGEYTFDGMYEGYPSYRGESDEIIRKFEGTIWQHTDTLGEVIYTCESAAYFPYDATGWGANDPSDLPAPAYTAEAASGALTDIEIESTFTATKANFIAALNVSANASINVANYTAGTARTQAIGTYATLGTGGNAFTLANSSFGSITRSGATFTGGAATAYALSISEFVNYFADGARVQFSTTGSLPTGISASTNYYITNYAIDGEIATFGVATTPNARATVISSAGSGVLTMALQESTDDIPLQLVSPKQAPLSQYLDSVFDFAFIQSNILTVLPIDDVFPTGSVAFAVPSFPANVADLPDSDEAEREFLQILANLVSVPVMPT